MFFPIQHDPAEWIRTDDVYAADDGPTLLLLLPDDGLTDYYEDKMDFDVGVGD